MISRLSPIQILLSLALLVSAQARQMCALCGSVSQTPNWDNVATTSPFMTCRQVYFQLASLESHDSRCSPLQQRFNNVCCGSGGTSFTPRPPQNVVQVGDQPTCDICRDASFPGIPNQMINARYVGTHSCGALYHRGRNGQIPGFMCGPLQHNLQQTCGCGLPNVYDNAATPPPPTPPHTRRPTYPPTRPPTRRPTRGPTPSPTRRPTRPPTPSPTRPPTKPPTPNPSTRPTPPPTRPPTKPPTPEFSATARKEAPNGDGAKEAHKFAYGREGQRFGQRRGLKESLILQQDPQESE